MKTFLRLARFILPDWRWLALAVTLGALTIFSGIGLLGTSAYLISAAALQPSIADLQVAIVGVRFFGLSRGLFRYLERLTSHNTTFRLLARLRTWFYQRLEMLAPGGLDDTRSGDLLQRLLGDIASLENFYLRLLAPLLVAALVILSLTVFMAVFDLRLAALILACLLGSALTLSWLAFRSSRIAGEQRLLAQAELRTSLVEVLQGLPDLLVYGGWEQKQDEIESAQLTLDTHERRLSSSAALQSGLTTLLAGLTGWGMLLLGIHLVETGRLPGLYLAVVVLAALAGFEAVQGLPAAMQHLPGNLKAADRLFQLADQEPITPPVSLPASLASHPHLHLDQVTFAYPGCLSSTPTLSGIDLDLPPGRHVGIVGTSGSGKSTLLALVMRYYPPASGQVHLGDQSSQEIDLDRWQSCFNYLSHDAYLFNTTLRENLLVADPAANEYQLQEALRLAGLQDFVADLPDGLQARLGEHGRQVSAGEGQRIAIARLLLQHAPICLLDEPTVHLDRRTEALLIRNLQMALQERSVLWVTHRLVGLEWMDEVLVLQAGRVVQRGRHADLLGVPGLYQEMWQAQNGLVALQDS